MATNRSFNAMLNEYLHYKLLWRELVDRSWLLKNVNVNMKWAGGPLIVPFMGQEASSLRMGALTAESDIAEYKPVRGSVDDYKELTGSLVFHERDITDHKTGKFKEQSLMADMPNMIERFVTYTKETSSMMFLNGPSFAKLTADSTANDGVVVIDRIERLRLGQKVRVDDDNSNALTGYVRSININTKTAVLYDARTGGAVIDFSGNNMTVAQNAKLYIDGADDSTNQFTSLRSQLLSNANGGTVNIFGVAKTAYPYTQAINLSGAGYTASNIVEKLFEHLVEVRTLAKGGDKKAVMSYKHLGWVMKNLEDGSGGYRHIETKVNPYGYTEITIGGGALGILNVVGVQEMDSDIIYFLDPKTITIHGHQFFEKHVDQNGNSYHTVRTEAGYKYIVDLFFRGELVCHAPDQNAIVYGIP